MALDFLFNFVGFFLITLGVLVILIVVLSAFRMSQFWKQLHIFSLVDTFGFVLVALGLMFLSGFSVVTLKIMFLLLLIWMLIPLNSYLLAQLKKSEKDRN